MKKKTVIIIVVCVLLAALIGPAVKFIPAAFSTIDEKTQAEIDAAKGLRQSTYEEIRNDEDTSFENRMTQKIYRDWANWVPDYEGWLKWSDGLYFADATIVAIGGEQTFRDYQASMKDQRDKFTMEMGPIKSFEIHDNVVELTYYMYLIPKDTLTKMMVGGAVKVTDVRELNTFEVDEETGELKVSRLELTTTAVKSREGIQ